MPTPPPDAILVFDRRRGELTRETVLGDRLLRLAYRPRWRPLCRWLLFRRRWVSRLLGWYCDSPLSRRRIRPTIAQLKLDEAQFRDPVASYRTFNEFFTRHLRADARPFDPGPSVLCSPADCRLLAFPRLDADTCVPIKGAAFTVPDLLRAPPGQTVPDFTGGALFVARLCPADYHRYHYPAAGRTVASWCVDGALESVNPVAVALGVRVFVENWRHVAILDLERFGPAAFVEVGAFGVGGVVQTHAASTFAKMDEKGYFRFGASTVILVLPAGRLRVDPDLLAHSAEGTETRVLAGEPLGAVGP